MLVLRAILPLFALCLLPACVAGTADRRVSGDYAALVEQVGVISLLHPHPHVNLLGSSALESRFRSAQVPGWTIDHLAQAQIEARLERRGLQARSIARDGAFATAYAADWRAPAADASIAAAAYAAGAAAGLDVVVVVQAALVPDFVTDTHQKVRGYGLQRAHDGTAHLYAAVNVEIFDVARRYVVGRATGTRATPAAQLWRDEFAAGSADVITLDDVQGADFAAALESLLTAVIGSTLQEAGL